MYSTKLQKQAHLRFTPHVYIPSACLRLPRSAVPFATSQQRPASLYTFTLGEHFICARPSAEPYEQNRLSP